MYVSGQLHTPAALFSEERDPSPHNHWIGGRVGPWADLKAES